MFDNRPAEPLVTVSNWEFGLESRSPAACYDRYFCTDDLIIDFDAAASFRRWCRSGKKGLPQPVRNLWTATGTGAGDAAY